MELATPLTRLMRAAVKSLDEVKGRRRQEAFKAEGTKCVLDTLGAFSCRALLATPAWAAEHPEALKGRNFIPCSRADLERMTSLTTAPEVIAVYALPHPLEPQPAQEELLLALDAIRDPGNLGTIIRVADWMGVEWILCSRDTVDCFSPKVVQATMGAISRVKVCYGDLPATLASLEAQGHPVCGTFLNGSDIYSAPVPRNGVLVIGNEGRGISPQVELCCSQRLTIPSYPQGRPTSESLNAAMATGLALARFRFGK